MATKFLQRPNGTIAYDDTGSGIPVVLVPGLGVLRSEYRFLAAQLLDAGYRVIMMDLRGHGESSTGWESYALIEMAGDILALIRHLDAGPVVLAGHSFSAGSAVWASVDAPDLVSGMVLLGPAVHGDPGTAMRLMMKALFARPWGPAAWMWYYGTLFPTRKPEDWATYTTALRLNVAQKGRLEAIQALMFESKAASAERLAKVSVPALVVMGSKDGDFKDPEGEARWIAEQVGGTYQMVEGAGHYPMTEMPEITGPLVVDFIQSLQVEAAHDPEYRAERR